MKNQQGSTAELMIIMPPILMSIDICQHPTTTNKENNNR